MTKIIEGKISGRGKRIAIVVAKFNEFITERLLAGCLDELKKSGVLKSNIIIAHVPGAYEIPVAALAFAKKKKIDAVICLGAVIRGETYHFELVAEGASNGITQVALMTGKPVVFGVLSTETVRQAQERSQEEGDNKGRDAALVALEMTSVLLQIKSV